MASQEGKWQIVDYLLRNKADPDSRSQINFRPYDIASQEGHREVLICFLEHQSRLEKKCHHLLHVITKNGDLKRANILIKEGYDVNETSQLGFTPLHYACFNGQTEMVKLLLDNHANVNYQSKTGIAPIHVTCHEGHGGVLDVLLKSKVSMSLTTKVGLTAIHCACKRGNVSEILKIINSLSNPLDIKDLINQATFINGYASIHLASQYGNLGCLEVLISLGSGIELKTNEGYTPLHNASYYNKINSACFLLDRKAKLENRTKTGLTALDIARKCNHQEMIDLLLEYRAIQNAQSNFKEPYEQESNTFKNYANILSIEDVIKKHENINKQLKEIQHSNRISLKDIDEKLSVDDYNEIPIIKLVPNQFTMNQKSAQLIDKIDGTLSELSSNFALSLCDQITIESYKGHEWIRSNKNGSANTSFRSKKDSFPFVNKFRLNCETTKSLELLKNYFEDINYQNSYKNINCDSNELTNASKKNESVISKNKFKNINSNYIEKRYKETNFENSDYTNSNISKPKVQAISKSVQTLQESELEVNKNLTLDAILKRSKSIQTNFKYNAKHNKLLLSRSMDKEFKTATSCVQTDCTIMNDYKIKNKINMKSNDKDSSSKLKIKSFNERANYLNEDKLYFDEESKHNINQNSIEPMLNLFEKTPKSNDCKNKYLKMQHSNNNSITDKMHHSNNNSINDKKLILNVNPNRKIFAEIDSEKNINDSENKEDFYKEDEFIDQDDYEYGRVLLKYKIEKTIPKESNNCKLENGKIITCETMKVEKLENIPLELEGIVNQIQQLFLDGDISLNKLF